MKLERLAKLDGFGKIAPRPPVLTPGDSAAFSGSGRFVSADEPT